MYIVILYLRIRCIKIQENSTMNSEELRCKRYSLKFDVICSFNLSKLITDVWQNRYTNKLYGGWHWTNRWHGICFECECRELATRFELAFRAHTVSCIGIVCCLIDVQLETTCTAYCLKLSVFNSNPTLISCDSNYACCSKN